MSKDPRLALLERAGLMLKSRTRVRIALALYESEKRSSELESLEGTSASSVHRILEELEGEGLVSRERRGEAVYWRLTGEGREILERLLGPRRRASRMTVNVASFVEAAAGAGLAMLAAIRGLLEGRLDWIVAGLLLGLILLAHSLYTTIRGSR